MVSNDWKTQLCAPRCCPGLQYLRHPNQDTFSCLIRTLAYNEDSEANDPDFEYEEEEEEESDNEEEEDEEEDEGEEEDEMDGEVDL